MNQYYCYYCTYNTYNKWPQDLITKKLPSPPSPKENVLTVLSFRNGASENPARNRPASNLLAHYL